MAWKKKKETAEELKAKLKELEEEELDVPPEPPKQLKKAKKEHPNIGLRSPMPKGEFSLNPDEMALAVNALANSEEFKVYQQMVMGQQIAEIIATYNKAIGDQSEVPSEETDEEELPTG